MKLYEINLGLGFKLMLSTALKNKHEVFFVKSIFLKSNYICNSNPVNFIELHTAFSNFCSNKYDTEVIYEQEYFKNKTAVKDKKIYLQIEVQGKKFYFDKYEAQLITNQLSFVQKQYDFMMIYDKQLEG